jgi:O-antigen ligase
MNIWLVASDVIADSPVVGYGVGSWAVVYPAYSYRREEALPYISDAHNLFVQVLVESGLVGALGSVVFFGMLLLRAIKSKSPVPLSFVLFVLTISMTANIKIVAPFLLLGTSLLYTFQRPHPGQALP